jgi:hypothetical protein
MALDSQRGRRELRRASAAMIDLGCAIDNSQDGGLGVGQQPWVRLSVQIEATGGGGSTVSDFECSDIRAQRLPLMGVLSYNTIEPFSASVVIVEGDGDENDVAVKCFLVEEA